MQNNYILGGLQYLEQLEASYIIYICTALHVCYTKINLGFDKFLDILSLLYVDKEHGCACVHLSSEFLDVPAVLWEMHWPPLKRILRRREDMQQGREIVALRGVPQPTCGKEMP